MVLFVLDYIPLTAVHTSCTVTRHQRPPSDPIYQCPLLVRCDPPNFTVVCVPDWPTSIDSGPIGVEPTSWTQVRSLYDR